MPKPKTLIFFLNIFFLITSVALVYFWTKNPETSLYTLQLIAVFALLYFLNQAISKKSPNMFVNTLIFTVVILLLVSTTGGLSSPLFFLVYFLLFGTSLMLAPTIMLILTMSLFFFFALFSPLTSFNNVITLTSLIFISPLALFFGRQYLKVLEKEKKITILEKTGSQLKQAIKKEETDSLMWLSLELKNGLLRIIDKTSEILSKPANLGWRQKEELEEILASSQRLLRTGEKLKKEIDEETD